MIAVYCQMMGATETLFFLKRLVHIFKSHLKSKLAMGTLTAVPRLYWQQEISLHGKIYFQQMVVFISL